MRRTKSVDLFWRIHPWVYRASGGRLLGTLVGMPVLLLTTTGARSGTRRTTALTYFSDGDSFVVVGSFLGASRHPGWVHNLRANPTARIQVGSRRREARAHEAEGEERARLWARALGEGASYEEYASRTTRKLPVVVLTPT